MTVRPPIPGRILRGGLLMTALLLIASCGEDSAPSAPEDTGNLDTGRAVTAQLGANGGTVDVADAGGAAYRLEIPSGALGAHATIVATPFVEADTGNDMAPLARGLLLEPAGLAFLVPVTMSVTLPSAPSGDIPALLHRSGDRPGEVLVASVNGNTLSTELTHFSDVTPVATTVAQLLAHWELLMGQFDAEGPSSDIAQQLGYTFLTVNIASLEGIPLAEWEADLNGVLAALIVVAVDHCNAGDCILGSNQLATAANVAAAIDNLDLVDVADSQTPLCDTAPLGVAIGFAGTIESAVPSPLSITVTSGSVPVEGAEVSIAVSGGSAAATAGTTDANGEFATTVLWDNSSSSVDVDVTATHPGCASPGAASDSATPSGSGGIKVESRDSEINVIASASYNLNPTGGNSTIVYDSWAFVENEDLSGMFSADTTRMGDGSGGGMTMSGSATASQNSSITMKGKSLEVAFEGSVNGDASLSNPPGGDASWQSYSGAFSDMSVTVTVFGASVPFQISGTIDDATDFGFSGEGVSICYEAGQPCPGAGWERPGRRVGINESGTLTGDPDGGNDYHFSIRVEKRLFYQDTSEPSSGNGTYSAMADVTLTIGN